MVCKGYIHNKVLWMSHIVFTRRKEMKRVCMLSLVLGLAVSAAQANLISNGGFESDGVSSATGWSHTSGDCVSFNYITDGSEVHSGNSSINVLQPTGACAWWESSSFSVTAGTTYTLTSWVKVVDLWADHPVDTYVKLGFNSGSGMVSNVVTSAASQDWTEYTMTWTASEDRSDVRAVLAYVQPSYVWSPRAAYFDDVTVTPEPATLGLLAIGGLLLRRKH
jgi:hypothetical protein